MIGDPVTVASDTALLLNALCRDARAQHQRCARSSMRDKPVGILTARDIRFAKDLQQPVSALMTRELVTVPPGMPVDRAKELLHQHRIEKLLGRRGRQAGRDSSPSRTCCKPMPHPFAVKDDRGRLLGSAPRLGLRPTASSAPTRWWRRASTCSS